MPICSAKFESGAILFACEISANAFDITGDGYPDQLSGSNWFENPGAAGATGMWTEHKTNGVKVQCADAILGDWNHDGNLDVAYVQRGDPSAWYEIPRTNPKGPWIEHVWPGIQIHSGMAAGNFNADGWLDAVIGNVLLLNKDAAGSAWEPVTCPATGVAMTAC